MPEVVPRPHPVKAVIADRRIPVKALAGAVGCNAHSLSRIINGYATAWPALRRRVAEVLQLPEASLFRPTPDGVDRVLEKAVELGIDTSVPTAASEAS